MPNLTPLSYGTIALICLMGIVHQWGEGGFPWWRLALVAWLISLAYEWASVRGNRIVAALADTRPLRLGNATDVSIQFENSETFFIDVQFVADLPDEFEADRSLRTASLRPGRTELSVQLRPLQLGGFAWPRLPTRQLGPLKLAWWSQPLSLEASLQVIPDMLASTGQAAGLVISGLSQRQRPGTGQELHHLREYRPGDPLHTIDWKATARSDALITRVFGEDQHLEIVVVIDVGRTSRTRIDGLSQLGHYVNLTARFAEHAVAGEDQVGMVAVTDRPVAVVPTGRGLDAVSAIRRGLVGLETQPVECDMLAAAREIGRFVRHRCLIVVLTDLYGATATGRLMQSVRLWSPQHLPMIVGLVGGELKEMAEQESADWLDPYRSLAARTYTEDLRRGMMGLNRLGAVTLISRPRDLERQVLARYQVLKAQRRI